MAKATAIRPVTPPIESVSLQLDYDEARALSALLYTGVGQSNNLHASRLSAIGRALRRAMGEAHRFEHAGTSIDEFVLKTERITDCVRDPGFTDRLRHHEDCYSGNQQICLVWNSHTDRGCPMKP
jgi:hypothetical protein